MNVESIDFVPPRSAAQQGVRRATAALGLLLLTIAAGCGRGGAPAAPSPATPAFDPVLSASRVYYDNSGGVRDSIRLVVRDDATLRAVWGQATSEQASPPPTPGVDFQREMLLVVGAGRRTPEDQIRVDSLAVQPARGAQARTLLVVVRTSEGCSRFNIDAYPLEIVRIERFDGPVEFVERRERATDC